MKVCTSAIITSCFAGMMPAKATKMKMAESSPSPTMVDRMARSEKLLPLLITFMRLITSALANEPLR